MAKVQGGLGRGLSALIPQTITETPEAQVMEAMVGVLREVAPASIVPNPQQPRKYFSAEELQELVASIKLHGILQPLVVTEVDGGNYELIAGERRLRASQAAGLSVVPVIVRSANAQEKLELALVENVQRHDLNAIEEAYAYQALMDQFSMTHSQIAERVGKSRPVIANTIRLLGLDEYILEAIMDGRISRTHGRALLTESDPARRKSMFEQILQGGVPTREIEIRANSPRKRATDPNVAALEAELREVFGTKVQVHHKMGRGKVTLHFYTKEDMRGLLTRLKGC